jgi:hypothetical protein
VVHGSVVIAVSLQILKEDRAVTKTHRSADKRGPH